MNPSELEFLAEDEKIQIIPRFKMDAVHLLAFRVGPFYPNTPTTVPLWVALHLRRQQRCRILPPDWLSVERLTACKEAEDAAPGCTPPPHRHYTEITTLLLEQAAEDLQNPETVRTLVRDLWDCRVGKLTASVTAFLNSEARSASVSQLTGLELASLRNFVTTSMDQLTTLRHQTKSTTNQTSLSGTLNASSSSNTPSY